jgi:O-antigen biosynthesis protein
MPELTASLLNINEAALTMNVLGKLAGLSDQGWQIQLILVDNGSRTDDLQTLFEWLVVNKGRFKEVLSLMASRNLGCTGGRNIALKLASSDRILILDNDVILPDDSTWLEKLWGRMESDPRVGVAAPMLVSADHPDIVLATGIGLTKRGRVGFINRAKPVTDVDPTSIEVLAAPTACWLVRREAQRAVGFFSEEYYPVQYEDVDLCVRLRLAGWKVLCDCSVRIKHIENVTTRNLKDHPIARLTVRHGMHFKEKWADLLPQLATLSEDEIYWGPIPRAKI